MLNGIMKIGTWVKESIIGPLCSPGDLLCKATDGRFSLPSSISRIIAPIEQGLISTSFMIGAVGLSAVALLKIYKRPNPKKNESPSRVDQILSGTAENFAAFSGAAFVLGADSMWVETPYYLARYGVQEVISPSEVPKNQKSFITERLKDLNVTAILIVTMKGISAITPFKGLLNTAVLGTLKKILGGILYRAESKILDETTDNVEPVFSKDKILKDALKGAVLYTTLDLSLRLFSDYLIDGDNDPSKYSQTAFIISGIAAELVYQYGLKASKANSEASPSTNRRSHRKLSQS